MTNETWIWFLWWNTCDFCEWLMLRALNLLILTVLLNGLLYATNIAKGWLVGWLIDWAYTLGPKQSFYNAKLNVSSQWIGLCQLTPLLREKPNLPWCPAWMQCPAFVFTALWEKAQLSKQCHVCLALARARWSSLPALKNGHAQSVVKQR